MKILLLTHEFTPFPGGVARYCASLAAAGARNGHDVTVLAPGYERHDLSPHVQDGYSLVPFAGDVFKFRHFNHLLRAIRSVLTDTGVRYDLVHAADWPAVIAMAHVATPGMRRIATLHGTDISLLRRSPRARLRRSVDALHSVDRIVCNSRFTQGLLREQFPKPARNSIVTPLGVDAYWFSPASQAARQALRERLVLQDDERIVLTTARLDSRKGHLTTIRALSQLPTQTRARLRYVCIGKCIEADYAHQLVQLANQLGVRLTLTGPLPQEELKAAYAMARVFALTGEPHPHKIEGFGLVLLEAAAQGLPVVVTRVHALPETVEHGRTGWIAEQPEQLTELFARALEEGADRSEMGARCIEHARAYSWEACAEETYGPAGSVPELGATPYAPPAA